MMTLLLAQHLILWLTSETKDLKIVSSKLGMLEQINQQFHI